jgi:hypothetical protein
MIKKVISITLATGAIAFNTTSLSATENYSKDNSESKVTFLCGAIQETPTMFAYTPGKTNLTPLMSWYKDYLLPNQTGAEVCEQVAMKLQAQYQQKQRIFFASEEKEDRTLVCLVSEEKGSCQSKNSEELFSVNLNYNPACVLNNRQPLECVAIGGTRGVLSMPESPYVPTWWPW